MTKIITLSLIASALFFTGCDQKTKNEVSEASSAVTDSVKEKTVEAADAVKDVAVEAKDNVAEKASDAADAAKDAMNP